MLKRFRRNLTVVCIEILFAICDPFVAFCLGVMAVMTAIIYLVSN